MSISPSSDRPGEQALASRSHYWARCRHPVGNSVATTWQAFLAGHSGIDRITRFDTADFDVKIAGEVKDFSLGSVVASKEARHLDLGTQYGLIATQEALTDAALSIDDGNAEQVGIIFGSARWRPRPATPPAAGPPRARLQTGSARCSCPISWPTQPAACWP